MDIYGYVQDIHIKHRFIGEEVAFGKYHHNVFISLMDGMKYSPTLWTSIDY